MIDEPSDAEVIVAAIETRLRGVHTAIPGTVVAYDPTTQTATIQPGVKLEISSGVWESVPPIPEVPIQWPGGTGGAFHAALAPGDGVLLICPEQDPTGWILGLGADLESKRRHSLGGFAIPGIRPVAKTMPAAAAAASGATVSGPTGGPTAHWTPAAILLGSLAAVDPVVLDSKLKTAIANACTAAAASPSAVVPAGGGSIAPTFVAFANSFAAALIGALKVKGE